MKEVFHERSSDMYGRVCLYPPSGEPETWIGRPWKVTTSKGPDSRLESLIKPEYIMEAFTRPHFIELNPHWIYEDDVDGSTHLDF